MMGLFSASDVTGIGAVASTVNTIVSRLWPDKTEEQKAQLAAALQDSQLAADLAKGQMAVNAAEAANASVFVAGWRPAIGWVCAVSLAAYYPPRFLAATILWVISVVKAGHWIAPQDVGISDILGLMGSMLGLAGLRTVETVKGVARQTIGKLR